MENDKPILVYSTMPTMAEADRIGTILVDERLAACINIIPAIAAIYRWEGRVEKGNECAMIVKSRSLLADAIVERVKALHPYANPALVVIEPTGGSADYMAWIMRETGHPRPTVP